MIERFEGCLLGGAVGDALGAPVEFLSLTGIRSRFGHGGVVELEEAYGRRGAVTDDTQMTVFTAEGLLRAESEHLWHGECHVAAHVHRAYLRWLRTQGERARGLDVPLDGWLRDVSELHSRRGPGNTCLSALCSGSRGSIAAPINDSKGCGGIMRTAPVALLAASAWPACAADGDPFMLAAELAALTHGHPSGYLSAGCLATIIYRVLRGSALPVAVSAARELAVAQRGGEECARAIARAEQAAARGTPAAETVESLGAGWTGEEALGIGVYCALTYSDDLPAALRLAANHGGDSDSTAAITGNILGALLGSSVIPESWLAALELRDLLEQLAEDLLTGPAGDERWLEKYPPV